MSEDTHYRIARKIYGNERLTDSDRKELRVNFRAVLAEIEAIFMRDHKQEATAAE